MNPLTLASDIFRRMPIGKSRRIKYLAGILFNQNISILESCARMCDAAHEDGKNAKHCALAFRILIERKKAKP